MNDAASGSPLAVVCGSGTPVGSAISVQLQNGGLPIVAVEAPGAQPNPAASRSFSGEIWSESFWTDVHDELRRTGWPVHYFVHALSGFVSTPGLGGATTSEAAERTLLSAEYGSHALLPLMPRGSGAIVLLASVLASWDSRVGYALFQAAQAGLLGLTRGLALDGAVYGARAIEGLAALARFRLGAGRSPG